MTRAIRRRRMGGLFENYLDKALSVGDLIGAWMRDEKSGTISYDQSGLGHHGTHVGVTLGQPGVPGMGYTCPLYDGALDYTDLQSVGLASAFDGKEGALIAWSKVKDAAVWTDDSYDRIVSFYADANNFISIVKWNTDNLVNFYYKAGGTQVSVAKAAVSDTGWICWGVTWSKIANGGLGEFKSYFRGLQHGATNVMDTFVGALAQTLLGSWTAPPNQPWNGFGGPALIYSKVKSPDQMAYLSEV